MPVTLPLEVDPRRRVLAVTLLGQHHPLARASWEAAVADWYEHNPRGRLDHWYVYGQDPHGFTSRYGIVVWKYRQVQQDMLAGDWQVLVTAEHDMVIPEHGLTALLQTLDDGADIAYALYVWRKGLRWNAYVELAEMVGESLSMRPDEARAAWGKTIDVAGLGLGFTAIKREVLENITFRRGHLACNDWFLALDAQMQGYTQRCNLGIACGHIDGDEVLWPDPRRDELWRAEPIKEQ